MIRRKLLGQHFLTSDKIAKTIVSEAKISKKDVVYEIGTGLGVLTPLLCTKAKQVISVEADKKLYCDAKSKFSEIKNLTVLSGDGFKKTNDFTIFVSNLPYSKSKKTVEWLAQKSFSHGIIMVQKEFAEKLNTQKDRRAVNIIANYAFDIKKICDVGKNNFSPPPKVDSVVLFIRKKHGMSLDLIHVVNKIFSYKRKTIQNIYKQFEKENNVTKRLDELSRDEIIELAQELG